MPAAGGNVLSDDGTGCRIGTLKRLTDFLGLAGIENQVVLPEYVQRSDLLPVVGLKGLTENGLVDVKQQEAEDRLLFREIVQGEHRAAEGEDALTAVYKIGIQMRRGDDKVTGMLRGVLYEVP